MASHLHDFLKCLTVNLASSPRFRSYTARWNIHNMLHLHNCVMGIWEGVKKIVQVIFIPMDTACIHL